MPHAESKCRGLLRGWKEVRVTHLTPSELVGCGVINASFFVNRTVLCTVRDPFTRLASAAAYRGLNVSAFLDLCKGASPLDSHDLWAHCRPQSDFVRFCHKAVPVDEIDTTMRTTLAQHGVLSLRSSATKRHKNTWTTKTRKATAAQLTALEMTRAIERYGCDFKLAASGWDPAVSRQASADGLCGGGGKASASQSPEAFTARLLDDALLDITQATLGRPSRRRPKRAAPPEDSETASQVPPQTSKTSYEQHVGKSRHTLKAGARPPKLGGTGRCCRGSGADRHCWTCSSRSKTASGRSRLSPRASAPRSISPRLAVRDRDRYPDP